MFTYANEPTSARKRELAAAIEKISRIRSKMGSGISKVLDGLYVGGLRDAQNKEELQKHGITHVVAIHDNAQKFFPDELKYLILEASDTPSQDLLLFMEQTNGFIHKARKEGGKVLVHCLVGASRSVTITIAYVMLVTNLGWRDTLSALRAARSLANPNLGFQTQLSKYEDEMLAKHKRIFTEFYKEDVYCENDHKLAVELRDQYKTTLNGDDDTHPLEHNSYDVSKQA